MYRFLDQIYQSRCYLSSLLLTNNHSHEFRSSLMYCSTSMPSQASLPIPSNSRTLRFGQALMLFSANLLKLRQSHRRRNHHLLLALLLHHYHLFLLFGDLAAFIEEDGQDNQQTSDAAHPPGPIQRDDRGRDHHVQHGERQQQLPAQAHQAVVANTRQRGPQPDEQEQEEGHFD